MLLAVDVGNTNTVLGVFEGEKLVDSWRVKTDAHGTSDEMALLYRGLLHGYDVSAICGCSTVPSVGRELKAMAERAYPDLPSVFVAPGVKTGVALNVDNPREVGADRIVNALAAHTLYGGAAVVVDFGTSTNMDVVTARGEFIGGVIAPGIEISVDALAARGAQLRKVELARPRSVIGRNTVECLQSGVIYGFAGQVDGLVRRILAELEDDDVTVVATGGLASLVLQECDTIDCWEPELTLVGLRMVFEKNAA